MKKILSISLASVLLLTQLTPVFALDTDVNSTPTLKTSPIRDLREEFRLKLAALKDENKKAIVTRLDARMAQINANRTAIMLRHLDIIQAVLNKLQARSATLDVSVAQKAIDSARATVIAQQAKVYTINITTEANLGQAVSATRKLLASDLLKAHQSVVAARKAVRAVLVTLNRSVGEKLETSPEDTK